MQLKLNDEQIEFIIVNFFLPISDLAGARTVATQLLRNGQCIVAGDTRMFHGGVGNYCKYEKAPSAVGCSAVKFDLTSFLASAWVREYINSRIAEAKVESEKLQHSIVEISELLSCYQEVEEPHSAEEDKKHMDRDDFMAFYRDDDLFSTLSVDDRMEVFMGCPVGASDITRSTLEELCNDYGTSLEGVLTPHIYDRQSLGEKMHWEHDGYDGTITFGNDRESPAVEWTLSAGKELPRNWEEIEAAVIAAASE